MKFLEKISNNKNKKQKLIVSISIPLILLILTLAIGDEIGWRSRGGAFDFSRTWYLWILFISVSGYLEYKIWGN